MLTFHKNVVVGTRQKSKRSYYITSLNEKTAANYTAELLRYTGDGPVPLWYDENKGTGSTLLLKLRLLNNSSFRHVRLVYNSR